MAEHRPGRTRRALRATLRGVDAVFERLGLRPLGLVVFALSALGLATLALDSAGVVRAPAVAGARAVTHASEVGGLVAEVHAREGDLVEAGAPLVTIASQPLRDELALVEAELRHVEQRGGLEALELELALLKLEHDQRWRAGEVTRRDAAAALEVARAEAALRAARQRLEAALALRDEVAARVTARLAPTRDLDAARWQADQEQAAAAELARVQRAERAHREALAAAVDALEAIETPDSVALRQASAAALAAERALLEQRRASLVRGLARLTVRARAAGRVQGIVAEGSAVLDGVPLATVHPLMAEEIVAYLPADRDPGRLDMDAAVSLVARHPTCAEKGRVLRLGAQVALAPAQVQSGLLRREVHGHPVHVSVPEGCRFSVGQTLEVELSLR